MTVLYASNPNPLRLESSCRSPNDCITGINYIFEQRVNGLGISDVEEDDDLVKDWKCMLTGKEKLTMKFCVKFGEGAEVCGFSLDWIGSL